VGVGVAVLVGVAVGVLVGVLVSAAAQFTVVSAPRFVTTVPEASYHAVPLSGSSSRVVR
jgi:hypothetical protein